NEQIQVNPVSLTSNHSNQRPKQSNSKHLKTHIQKTYEKQHPKRNQNTQNKPDAQSSKTTQISPGRQNAANISLPNHIFYCQRPGPKGQCRSVKRLLRGLAGDVNTLSRLPKIAVSAGKPPFPPPIPAGGPKE
ncbi:hypothetical protein, partial [Gluconacetobacter johannae]|uniref:hypothetical protein n=1 Tax=Gluconacetobacter johannae TaxID=112140 RepID=UPI001C7EB419